MEEGETLERSLGFDGMFLEMKTGCIPEPSVWNWVLSDIAHKLTTMMPISRRESPGKTPQWMLCDMRGSVPVSSMVTMFVKPGGKAAHSCVGSLPLQSPSELTLLTYYVIWHRGLFCRELLEFRSLAAMVILGYVPFNSLVPLYAVSVFLSFLLLWHLKI